MSSPDGARTATLAGYASLLTSAGTLVCCTLPALLVALGAGAVLASAVTVFPALVWLSEHKDVVFGVAGAMLAAAGVAQWRARALPCPAEPRKAAACMSARRTAGRVYALSVGVFALGGLFAFVLPWLQGA
jgi:hypothetical protein